MLLQKVEAASHAAQHAKSQNIDLHEAQGVDVVLVPFDGLAVRHAGRFDRYQIVQSILGQHEPAGMLRQMAGEADQRAREFHRQPQSSVLFVEVELGQIVPVVSRMG